MKKVIIVTLGILLALVVIFLWMFSAPRLLTSEEIPIMDGAQEIEKDFDLIALPDNVPGRTVQYKVPVSVSTTEILDFYQSYFPKHGWGEMLRKDKDLAEYFLRGGDIASKLCFTRDKKEQLFVSVSPDQLEPHPMTNNVTVEQLREEIRQHPVGTWNIVRISHSVYPGSALTCEGHGYMHDYMN